MNMYKYEYSIDEIMLQRKREQNVSLSDILLQYQEFVQNIKEQNIIYERMYHEYIKCKKENANIAQDNENMRKENANIAKDNILMKQSINEMKQAIDEIQKNQNNFKNQNDQVLIAHLEEEKIEQYSSGYDGDPDDDLCVICLDSKKDHAINDCGHLCLCESCYKVGNIVKCPICKKDIISIIKIFQ